MFSKTKQADLQKITEVFKSLKFGEKMSSTELADEYFEEHNCSFFPYFNGRLIPENKLKEKKTAKDSASNDIFISNTDKPLVFNVVNNNVCKIFCEYIKQKAELIVQLEYYNGRLRDDVLQEIDLIVDEIQHYAKDYDLHSSDYVVSECIPLSYTHSQNESLIDLKDALKFSLATGNALFIRAGINQAALCSFFLELYQACICAKGNISLNFHDDSVKIIDSLKFGLCSRNSNNHNASVVITESADIESVVHILLNRPYYSAPWTVKRIFIQESVYSKFKRIVKQHVAKIELTKPYSDFKELCLKSGVETTFINCSLNRAKVIFWDLVMDEVIQGICMIHCQAYRTTKELLHLLSQSNYSYLSVWCNNVTVVNEISHNSNSDHIWINSYALFETNLRISFDNFILRVKSKKVVEDMQNKWRNTPSEERLQIINKLHVDIPDSKTENILIKNNFVMYKIRNNKQRIALISSCDVESEVRTYIKLALLNDYDVIIIALLSFNQPWLLELIENGLPIVKYECGEEILDSATLVCHNNPNEIPDYNAFTKFKSIWSPLSETFAN